MQFPSWVSFLFKAERESLFALVFPSPRVRLFVVRFAPLCILAMGISHRGHVNACKSTCILEFTRATSQQQHSLTHEALVFSSL